ncbi:MAG TPA: MFS transporter, partial [Candidatus Binatia bacterium]|nr:MFS transporter [Candidatus Binatia bacterium]
MFRDLHHDAKLLMISRGIRAFAFSYLGVIFAIYLDRLGYSTVVVGMIFSVAYISSALLTAVWGYLSDRLGRRRILMLLAVLTIVSNVIYLLFSSLFFILLAVVVASVGAGGSGGGGSGGGPFNPVEEALLAEKCSAENRNQVFSINSFVGSMMGSLGALGSGLPQYLQESWGWEEVSSYKPLFAATILFSIILLFVYSSISEKHEPRKVEKKIS